MQKYNIALLPNTKSKELIELAQQFSKSADIYLLGENSLPHVTLYQFWKKEAVIEQIWLKVNSVWKFSACMLNFSNVSYFSRDNKIFYISLLPDEISILQKMHALIAQTLHLPVKVNFDPHITLFNTNEASLNLDILKSQSFHIKDHFTLRLGSCDEVGQFTKILSY